MIVIGIALAAYLTWYFRSIIAYIIAAGVISLIGRPIVELLNSFHIRKMRFPRALSSLLTLLLIFGLLALFFVIFIPLISKQIDALSGFDAGEIVRGVQEQLEKLDSLARKIYKNMPAETTLYDLAVEKITEILKPASITNMAGNLLGVVGKVMVAFVAVTFLAFFFLKDEGLFKETVMVLVPTHYEERIRSVLH